MVSKVKHYRTKTPGKIPTSSSIEEGEIAINLADKKIYTKSGAEVIELVPVSDSGRELKIDYIPPQSGYRHVIAIGKDGYLYTWGINTHSCLPIGGEYGAGERKSIPYKVPQLDYTSGIKKAGASGSCTWVLMNDGKLYFWGVNGHGQGATGDSKLRNTVTLSQTGVEDILPPDRIQFNYTAITFYFKKGGSWYGCGDNSYGRMGNGTTASVIIPVKLALPEGTIKRLWNFSGSYGCVFAESSSGKLYSSGCNSSGQLGNGNTTHQSRWQLVQGNITNIKTLVGESGGHGGSANSAGTVAVLTDSGDIYTWGHNVNGALGDGSDKIRSVPQKIAVPFKPKELFSQGGGYYCSFYIVDYDANKLAVWGYNAQGQLGLGDTTVRKTPVLKSVSIKKMFFGKGAHQRAYNCNPAYLDDSDNVHLCGYNGYGQLGTCDKVNKTSWTIPSMGVGNYGSVKQIVCLNPDAGDSASYVLYEDGTLFGFGCGSYNWLGGTKNDTTYHAANPVPLQVI